MKKKQFITLVVSLIFIGLSLPASFAQAQALPKLLPFGGLVSYPITCTCSPGNIWIWFTPLYLGGPINITGPMVYSPFSTILYGYYMIGVPGKWHLGDYVPGVQACWIKVYKFCVPLPAVGLMSKVGTNY